MSGRSHLIASGLMGILVGTLAAIPILNVSFYCCCLPLVVGVAGAIFMTLKTNDNAPMSNNRAMLIGVLTAIVATVVFFIVGLSLDLLVVALMPQYREALSQDPLQGWLVESIGVGGGAVVFSLVAKTVHSLILGVIFCVLSPIFAVATLNFAFPKRLEGAE